MNWPWKRRHRVELRGDFLVRLDGVYEVACSDNAHGGHIVNGLVVNGGAAHFLYDERLRTTEPSERNYMSLSIAHAGRQ